MLQPGKLYKVISTRHIDNRIYPNTIITDQGFDRYAGFNSEICRLNVGDIFLCCSEIIACKTKPHAGLYGAQLYVVSILFKDISGYIATVEWHIKDLDLAFVEL